MIGKQYKKDQEREKKGARTGLESDQEWVWKEGKTGFERYKKWNLARFEHLERAKTAPWPLSRFLLPFLHRSAPFFTRFHNFSQKWEKRCQNLEERQRKEKRAFLFLSHFYF